MNSNRSEDNLQANSKKCKTVFDMLKDAAKEQFKIEKIKLESKPQIPNSNVNLYIHTY